ncbi:hypothetical protein [Nonomuraea angiospora]
MAAFQVALERAQRFIHEVDPAEITRLLTVSLKGIDPEALTELPGLMHTEILESIGFTRASFRLGRRLPPCDRPGRASPTRAPDALTERPIEPLVSHVRPIIQGRARPDRRVQIIAAPEMRGVEIR